MSIMPYSGTLSGVGRYARKYGGGKMSRFRRSSVRRFPKRRFTRKSFRGRTMYRKKRGIVGHQKGYGKSFKKELAQGFPKCDMMYKYYPATWLNGQFMTARRRLVVRPFRSSDKLGMKYFVAMFGLPSAEGDYSNPKFVPCYKSQFMRVYNDIKIMQGGTGALPVQLRECSAVASPLEGYAFKPEPSVEVAPVNLIVFTPSLVGANAGGGAVIGAVKFPFPLACGMQIDKSSLAAKVPIQRVDAPMDAAPNRGW